MIFAVLPFLALSQQAPVELTRKFTTGEKLTYRVEAELNSEERSGMTQTWIPSDFNLSYAFTTLVKAVKADGIADMEYRRPNFVTVEGETFEKAPVRRVEKDPSTVLLKISPINEIIDYKIVTPPKKPVKKPVKKGKANWATTTPNVQIPIVGEFIGELQRLSLFVGSLSSALDFNPKFPFEEVKVGDTWQRTVSYQPQKLKGKNGKQAVQRLDFTYMYAGEMTVGGKKIRRVTGTTKLDTDLGEFFNQLFDAKPDETGLKGMPLKFEATIEFDLDPANGRTLKAVAKSNGNFQLFLTDRPDEAVMEQKFKGQTIMSLTSVGKA
ncbi:hypothetical protein EON81_01595 [bacterium]|nr:MAG: hypothetical protein EON81_01595 [bacterium]